MKKTFIKKTVDEFYKVLKENYGSKCEVQAIELKTCINKEAQLFVRVVAVVDLPDDDEHSYKVSKDFDL